jgi:hypothetical protein
MAITATTELEAINTMLSTIGESPINTLADTPGVVDAVMARSILKEVSVQVQEEGWPFNTEREFILTPDINKQITLPPNCIQVEADGDDTGYLLAQRGQRLYDRMAHTFSFEKPISTSMILLFEFEELPQAARHYIMIRAARVFQQRMVGSEVLGSFTEKDEMRARSALKKLEGDTGGFNILSSNYSVARILDR